MQGWFGVFLSRVLFLLGRLKYHWTKSSGLFLPNSGIYNRETNPPLGLVFFSKRSAPVKVNDTAASLKSNRAPTVSPTGVNRRMIKGAVFQKHFNTQTETNQERLGEVCTREVNAIPQNVAARFTSPICPLTAWQKVNICISRAISNFPTKSRLCYDHERLPKDARYIK